MISKRLILMSDLGGEFADDQVDTIIASIKNSQTELNVMYVFVFTRFHLFHVSIRKKMLLTPYHVCIVYVCTYFMHIIFTSFKVKSHSTILCVP